MKFMLFLLLLMLPAGCALIPHETTGGTFTHRFTLPPQKAASCFAHNAEEHSSALVAEVQPRDARGRVSVIVRVRNGITYANAEIEPAGTGSTGTIELMVISSGGAGELMRSLVEGC
jgi:hypothetical protein